MATIIDDRPRHLATLRVHRQTESPRQPAGARQVIIDADWVPTGMTRTSTNARRQTAATHSDGAAIWIELAHLNLVCMYLLLAGAIMLGGVATIEILAILILR